MTPAVRLGLRAALVGVTSLLVQLQQSAAWDGALLRAAITGAVLAALEVLTPLNALVGVAKPPVHLQANPGTAKKQGSPL